MKTKTVKIMKTDTKTCENHKLVIKTVKKYEDRHQDLVKIMKTDIKIGGEKSWKLTLCQIGRGL